MMTPYFRNFKGILKQNNSIGDHIPSDQLSQKMRRMRSYLVWKFEKHEFWNKLLHW